MHSATKLNTVAELACKLFLLSILLLIKIFKQKPAIIVLISTTDHAHNLQPSPFHSPIHADVRSSSKLSAKEHTLALINNIHVNVFK